MKNKITIISVILLSVLFFIVSCKKDNLNNLKQSTNKDTYSQNVIKRIENFRQQMQENFKSGTLMTLDTAVWNLEALLTNYGGYPDSSSKHFMLMHSHFTLPVTGNNMVSMDDVQAVYQQMVDSITAQLNGIAGSIKFLKFSDVQQDSVVGNTAYLTSNNGYGNGFVMGIYWPFATDDDWIWGTLYEIIGDPPSGKCDGTQVGISDGSNELKWRLNNPIVQPGPGLSTDIETVNVNFINCYYNEPPQLPRVFHTLNNNYCLENEELTYYLEAANWIIYDYNDTSNDGGGLYILDGEGARPEGKDFISIQILDYFEYLNLNYFHHYMITYGIKTNILPD